MDQGGAAYEAARAVPRGPADWRSSGEALPTAQRRRYPPPLVLTDALLVAVWYLSVGLGVTVGYHRVLTHGSARLARPVLVALVWAGIPAGPVAEWVGNHRRHHRHADSVLDPHSPACAGFWYAHCGWYLGIASRAGCIAYALGGPLRLLLDVALRPTQPTGHARLAPDVLADPLLRWLSGRSGYAVAASTHLLPFALAIQRHGSWGLVTAWASSIVMYNVGDCVNSVLHLWGRSDLRVRDASRNHPLLACLTLGEGWHNGHHAFPSSAKHGLLAGQFDLSFEAMRLLRTLKLARDLRLPTAAQIERRLPDPPRANVNLDEAVLGFILFCLWPLWMVAGVVDYFCHRATRIEHNAGVKESVLHIVMGFQVGIPVFVALVFKINVLVMLICLLTLVAHEVVAIWDMRLATPVRRISLVETHAHAYLLTMPFYTFALVALRNWDAFTRTLSFEWTEPFALVLRDKPVGPAGYLAFHFALVFCLGLLPYGEELVRCLRARRRAVQSTAASRAA